ncbi:preprotein translocase subunit YajC [Roseimicrobium gellanilyticum]|uniref:Sec translocon accessory complex subunit YajC n=1 Tax=Roseimicrobium gellanilyticum TaxID=748857 RepID=A0A366HJN4_9BACT|nr:preprotein translocase subunit YajC [Roseimicrobium gellanilyticum]RBP42575.1 preprotein translocase subunit YajC [Roseimicrobium gellanilyticum]
MIHSVITAHAALLAQGAPPPPGGGGGNFAVMMILMMVMMYFLLIRPQRKKQKESEDLQKAIAPGDEVVTIGGAHGTVTTVKENTVVVRMIEGKVEFDRSAIARKITPKDATPAEVKK